MGSLNRIALLTAFVIAAAVAAPAADPQLEAAVNSAIQNFTPLWNPAPNELPGWRFGLDPAWPTAEDAAQRQAADLSLMTAAHLYHHCHRAGSAAVLSRVDDTYAPLADQPNVELRCAALQRDPCDAVIVLRYHAGDPPATVRAIANSPLKDDAALAAALAAALGTSVTADDGTLAELRSAGLNLPLCLVSLAAPAPAPLLGARERNACLANARRLFEGLRAYGHTEQAHALRNADGAAAPDFHGSRVDTYSARIARRLCPDDTLPRDRVAWFCREYAHAAISNQSLVYFDVTADRAGDTTILGGCTNFPAVAAGLADTLRRLDVGLVRNEVRALPDRARLGDRLFGACRAPNALLTATPTGGALQTQLLFGEPVFLLDGTADAYLLHAGDGYWGWVARDAIHPLGAAEFDAYLNLSTAVAVQDIEIPPVRIPRGATLRVARARAGETVVRLPDGTLLPVPAEALLRDEHATANAAARVRAALDLLYVPYVFGGSSPRGLDCSGLVTTACVQTGGRPARDAWQQALAGTLVATPWHRANARTGDQVFFINPSGKTYHTGLMLDATHVIHSAPPCVRIGSLDPASPLYDPELDECLLVIKRP